MPLYECLNCGRRIEVSESPGYCPACGGVMQNLSIRRE
jgi:rubrerythrin